MDHRAIIAEAYHLSQQYKKPFFLFGFVVAFLTLAVETLWFAWQYVSFKNAPNLTGNDLYFSQLFDRISQAFSTNTSLVTWSIVVVAIIILCAFLLTPIFEAGLIVLIKRAKDGLEVKKRVGLSEGVFNFFRMFAFYNLVAFVLNILSIFTYATLPLKFVSWGAFYVLLGPAIIWFIGAIVGNALFIYTKFFLVLRKQKVGPAMKSSAQFVIRYLSETFVVFVLMILISLRVLLNILFVFIIPAALTSIILYFVQSLIGYQYHIIFTLGFLMLIVSSWIYGRFLIFTTAVWELTFLTLEEKDRQFKEEQGVSDENNEEEEE